MAINQYSRTEGNGPNAHKKGNRTDSRRETDHLKEFSKRQSEDIARYKEQAEKRRKARKYRQEDLGTILARLNDYIHTQTEQEKPLTVAGMIRAAEVGKDTWYRMIGGEYDYRLIEYCDLHDIDIDTIPLDGIPTATDDDGNEIALIAYSEALQKAMLAIEEQTEERLYSKGRVGDIFSLKAVHGWQEDSHPQQVTNNLVIASPEQAKRAIDLLK